MTAPTSVLCSSLISKWPTRVLTCVSAATALAQIALPLKSVCTKVRQHGSQTKVISVSDTTLNFNFILLCFTINTLTDKNVQLNYLCLRHAADHSYNVVSIQPSIADVQIGHNLELNCFAPGNPPPPVIWTKASGHLSANHQVIKHCASLFLHLIRDILYASKGK